MKSMWPDRERIESWIPATGKVASWESHNCKCFAVQSLSVKLEGPCDQFLGHISANDVLDGGLLLIYGGSKGLEFRRVVLVESNIFHSRRKRISVEHPRRVRMGVTQSRFALCCEGRWSESIPGK